MKAAIFNPYLDTLGGGEKYTFSFAKILSEEGHQVDVQWKEKDILKKAEDRFGLKLDNVRVVENINRGDGCEVCFWVSDGSIPTLKARNNILHFQVPFQNVGGKTLLNKMKLIRVKNVVCNSNFTKSFIDKEYGVNSKVIYPPIDIPSNSSVSKENLILYIGRFSNLLQTKRQDVLIDSFKKLLKSKIGRWKMVLAGGTEVGANQFLKGVISKSKGYPIEILQSPSHEKIISLYKKAKIFWSAAGFGIKENKDPQKVEHFGLTVAEAMSFGVVPLCYEAGGHKEIVISGKNGFLWTDPKKLIETSLELIKKPEHLQEISDLSKNSVMKYDYLNFRKDVKSIL